MLSEVTLHHKSRGGRRGAKNFCGTIDATDTSGTIPSCNSALDQFAGRFIGRPRDEWIRRHRSIAGCWFLFRRSAGKASLRLFQTTQILHRCSLEHVDPSGCLVDPCSILQPIEGCQDTVITLLGLVDFSSLQLHLGIIGSQGQRPMVSSQRFVQLAGGLQAIAAQGPGTGRIPFRLQRLAASGIGFLQAVGFQVHSSETLDQRGI